jgi:hypothetical protein
MNRVLVWSAAGGVLLAAVTGLVIATVDQHRVLIGSGIAAGLALADLAEVSVRLNGNGRALRCESSAPVVAISMLVVALRIVTRISIK